MNKILYSSVLNRNPVPMTMNDETILEDLLKTCQFIAQKGLSPATAGNFSARLTPETMIVSASGKDKSQLTKSDFVICDFNANLRNGLGKPSDEAHLHGAIYQLSPQACCVLHTHSVPTTVLSMLTPDNKMIFHGYEMQKTICGNDTHEKSLAIMIVDNDQNIPRLAEQVKQQWHAIQPAHGFIVRGHGLYSWGKSVFEAKRHMEGLEFLLSCELAKSQLVNV